MSVCIITGSSGLVGSEAVRYFIGEGFQVVGFDNNMRAQFFGLDASTEHVTRVLQEDYTVDQFRPLALDIRDAERVDHAFRTYRDVELVIHCAAQPAHDWAARDPRMDFGVNAVGTLNMLEAARRYTAVDVPFIHCSTSKVYGANPNKLPLHQYPTRLDLKNGHPYWNGITTDMSIDHTTHSLFGASKAAADLLVQEYGRYFHMPTVCFRPGCLTGPQHAGAELHGFLSYLMKCLMTGEHYNVIGYGGLQVRCNLHSLDLVKAFDCWRRNPRGVGMVYNIGGGRVSNCSMREAIVAAESIVGYRLDWTYHDEPRIGDHKWWISSNEAFYLDYPEWHVRHDTRAILKEIFEHNSERWAR